MVKCVLIQYPAVYFTKQMMTYTEMPVLMLLNTQPSPAADLPICLYESVVDLAGQEVETPFELEGGEESWSGVHLHILET